MTQASPLKTEKVNREKKIKNKKKQCNIKLYFSFPSCLKKDVKANYFCLLIPRKCNDELVISDFICFDYTKHITLFCTSKY